MTTPKSISFFLLLFFSMASFAQNETIDSLLKVLLIQNEDTAKVNTLNAIVSEFRYSNLDTANYFVNKALALATKLNYEMGIADSKLRIGALCASRGKFDEGSKSANDALVLYEKLLSSATASDKEKILAKMGRTYLIMGHNEISQGNYPKGLKSTFHSLKIKEELGDEKGIADTEFNLGNIYYRQHDYSEALKHYSVSLKIYQQRENKADIASTYGNIACVYFEQGNYAEAFKNNLTALKLAEEAKDNFVLAEIYDNLGVLSERQGNYSDALKYDFDALKMYKEIGINQQIPWIYNNIGLVYLRQKKYNDADEYFDKALSYSKMIGSLEFTKLSYENIAALDSVRGNFKKSLENYKMFIALRDSLYSEENTKKLVQHQMQYDFDKKEAASKNEQDKKEVLAKAEIKRQALIRNFSFSAIALILIFGGYSFYRYRKQKKSENKQSLLNERLRISRDLHDEIGSTLGSISVYSEVAKNRATKNENETEVLSKIGTASRELIDKMSDIVWSLNPQNETFEHLQNRMQSFAAMILPPHNIAFDFSFDEQLKSTQLTSEQRKNVFLIFKEAIYNVVKYAEATEVKVKVKMKESKLTLGVIDNGKGFDINNIVTHNGNGLKNMKARTDEMKGRLEIKSDASAGTTIELNLNV